MRQLNQDTRKRLMWLLQAAVKAGGEHTFTSTPTQPGFTVRLFNSDEAGAELLVFLNNPNLSPTFPDGTPRTKAHSYLESDWAFRVIILREVLAEEMPVYPTMWIDTENGLHHLVSWIGENNEQPDLMAPLDFYDRAVQLINLHIARLWHTHNLPAFKNDTQQNQGHPAGAESPQTPAAAYA